MRQYKNGRKLVLFFGEGKSQTKNVSEVFFIPTLTHSLLLYWGCVFWGEIKDDTSWSHKLQNDSFKHESGIEIRKLDALLFLNKNKSVQI